MEKLHTIARCFYSPSHRNGCVLTEDALYRWKLCKWQTREIHNCIQLLSFLSSIGSGHKQMWSASLTLVTHQTNWLLSHRSVAISATEAAFRIASGFIKLFLDLDNNIISRFVATLLDWHAAPFSAGRSRTCGKCTAITQTVGFWSIPKNVQQSPTAHIISSEYIDSQLNTRKLQQTNKKLGPPNLCMYRGSDLNLSHIPGHPVRELSQTKLWYQIRN